MLTHHFEWNELTTRQLRHVWRLTEEYGDNRSRRNLDAWMYLNDLEMVRGGATTCPDGTTEYRFRKRRRGLRLTPRSRRQTWYGVRADDLTLALDGFHPADDDDPALKEHRRKGLMDFLDDPLHLTVFPEEFVSIGRTRYKCPDPDMTSLTWQQYGNLQKLMQAYWQLGESLKRELAQDTEMTPRRAEALAAQGGQMEELKARFLAHLLVSPRQQFFSTNGDGIRWDPRKDYTYSAERAERRIRAMRKAPDWLFTIAWQWMQSCQRLMQKLFPDLFTTAANNDRRAPIIAEIDTINAIMKWEGTYPTQQDVYDTNAIFILGNLKDMTRESREIERLNAKAKRK